MSLSRSELIELAERYFLACNDHNWQAVMDTFSASCLMWFPAASFSYNGKAALGTHFEDFLGTFEVIRFHDFSHISDPDGQSICTYFTVELVQANGHAVSMKNCNIFRVGDDGCFEEIIIYNSAKLDAGFHAGSD